MRIYDVSVPISNKTPTYPGDPEVEIRQYLSLAKGDPANVSLIHFGAHTGTHVDAPAHFFEGASQVESLQLDVLIGEAQVVEAPDDLVAIDEAFVAAKCPPGAKRILFKTRNSIFWNDEIRQFHEDYTYIDPEAARELVRRGVQLVGIDYLSVERFQTHKFETHEALLSSRVVIVEGLDLRGVRAGVYQFICLPLRIAGGCGDGAPARAILQSLD